MALTQVRAKLGEEWVVLTYNEATGRYEGQLTPSGTSIHQPGGYFPVTVEATNDSGDTATATGETMASLRLVVRETTAPVLTLISPAPGYLQTGTPTFVFDATDEAGGSGVDPESFSITPSVTAYGGDSSLREGALAPLTEGGASEGGGGSYTPIPGGYRFTWTPPGGWSDGPHTVTASVEDYDGNPASVSGAYTVDTVPPELYLTAPYMRHITDAETVIVAGSVSDLTSGVGAVTVTGEAVEVVSGRFAREVDLAVGENTIPIVVTDNAGNQTTGSVYMIRLITDRTKADVAVLEELYSRPGEWTADELEWFLIGLSKGAYNAEDLNRVITAYKWLASELHRRGYIANVQDIPINHVVQIFETDENGDYVTVEVDGELYYVVKEVQRWTDQTWIEDDAPTQPQMATYLQNVETVRSAQGLYVPDIPYTMRRSTVEDWNNIEKALVETDKYFPNYFAWSSGEISCGGY